jgi:hypothetical protein
MTTKPNLGIIHKILIIFVALNIIGDIGNIAFWWVNPSSRDASLNTGLYSINCRQRKCVDCRNSYSVSGFNGLRCALFGLLKKMAWAPLIVIVISVVNRVIALPLYFISPAFAFWTVILVVVSFLDWKKLKA